MSGAQRKILLYDKSGEEHYNIASALIKSMRGSDPDAALYWLLRMLDAGEDPLFLLRRLMIFASEDVGNATPGRSKSQSAPTRRFAGWACPKAFIRSRTHACTWRAARSRRP